MDPSSNQPVLAATTLAPNFDNIAALHAFEQRDIKMISPKGFYALPNVNDKILLSSVNNPFLLGVLTNPDVSISPGEILIKNDSGAYIKLCQNGDVEINNITITSIGEIKYNRPKA